MYQTDRDGLGGRPKHDRCQIEPDSGCYEGLRVRESQSSKKKNDDTDLRRWPVFLTKGS
jgi:hypothetical protein